MDTAMATEVTGLLCPRSIPASAVSHRLVHKRYECQARMTADSAIQRLAACLTGAWGTSASTSLLSLRVAGVCPAALLPTAAAQDLRLGGKVVGRSDQVTWSRWIYACECQAHEHTEAI